MDPTGRSRRKPPRASTAAEPTPWGKARQKARLDIFGVRVRTKVWLDRRGTFVVGEGGLRLLRQIARRGSLAAAARRIGWSYRHAWGYLRAAETALGTSLTRPRAGKGSACGTALTQDGRALIAAFGRIRSAVDRVVGPSGMTEQEVATRGRMREAGVTLPPRALHPELPARSRTLRRSRAD